MEGSGGKDKSVFCGACGTRLDAGGRFCTSCGASQAQFAEVAGEEGGMGEPVGATPTPAHEQSGDESTASAPTEAMPAQVAGGEEPPTSSPVVTDMDIADKASAGWYPENDRWLRYWDGRDWTDDRHPAGQINSASGSGARASRSASQGRLGSALHQARAAGDTQALATFWLGIASVACFALGVPTQATILGWGALLAGIAAIVTARFVRDRARAADDAELLYLSRYGQILGWVVVGIFIVVLLFLAVFVGSLLGSASS